MLEPDRLSGDSDRFELGFVERESTPEPAMKLGIRLHLAILSLSNTILILDNLGAERCRSTVHDGVQKAELQPTDGADPDHVAVDETVIQLDDERYRLYAAIDSDTNRLHHVRLFSTRTQALVDTFAPDSARNISSTTRSFSSTAHPVASGLPSPRTPIPARHTREAECLRTYL